jgi:hypothetical protein
MSEKIASADAIALAALDTYLNKEPSDLICPGQTEGCRHTYKWGLAKDKVVEYSNANKMTFVDGPQTINAGQINAANSGVKVKPGRWWTERPATCGAGATPTCPCDSVNGVVPPLNKPCFQECDEGAAACDSPGGVGDRFATAMSVTLTTEGQGGIKTMFAKMMGVEKIDVEGAAFVSATGSVSFALPQIQVLLFDLSRSSTMDNYLPFERAQVGFDPVTNSDRQEYSFPVQAGMAACSPAGVASSCLGACPIAVSPTANFTPADAFQKEYTNTSTINPAVGTTYTAAKWNEYKCYSGSLNGATEKHLVATLGRPPEPYATLLAALNRYLVRFKQIGRAGDKIMLLGFDNADIPERHFPPKVAGVPMFLDPDDPVLDNLITMTSNLDEAAKKMFFPRAYSKLDLSKALRTAADQILTVYPSGQIDPSVTLFSNGFSMCSDTNPATLSQYCAGLTDIATANATLNMRHWEKQLTSLDEALVKVAESYLKPNRIRANVVSGNVGMPSGTSALQIHNAMMGHWSNGKCATDLDFRRTRYLYVIPYPEDPILPAPQVFRDRMIAEYANIGRRPASPELNIPAAAPLPLFPFGVRYVQPSKYVYSIAATTLGKYVPLRPECTVLTEGMANTACQTSILSGSPPNLSDRINRTRSECYKPLIPDLEIDSEGRLLCEPKGPKSAFTPLVDDFVENVTQSRLITLVMPN